MKASLQKVQKGGARAEILLIVRDAGGPRDPPLAVRLRMALKRLLRTFALRVVRIEPFNSRFLP